MRSAARDEYGLLDCRLSLAKEFCEALGMGGSVDSIDGAMSRNELLARVATMSHLSNVPQKVLEERLLVLLEESVLWEPEPGRYRLFQ
jgi:hypothetical protein